MSTNYLKNFAEGETIKASETNANNQFLLNKISDNASDIQLTVQTQISNVKSELATTKNSLLTELEQKLSKADKEEIISWTDPVYSETIDVTLPYTAEKAGIIYFHIFQNDSDTNVYINDVFIAQYREYADGADSNNFSFRLSKGDVIRATRAVGRPRFVPLRGVQ